MHELSIAQGIVELLKRHLPAGEKQVIKSIKLKVGDLTRIAPESLEYCFNAASEGTAAQGARLEIENVPAVYRCKECDSEFKAWNFIAICPTCGNPGAELISGDELDIVEIELVE